MADADRSENVRIVHAHDFYSNVIGVAAARLAGARSIAQPPRSGPLARRGTQRKALRLGLPARRRAWSPTPRAVGRADRARLRAVPRRQAARGPERHRRRALRSAGLRARPTRCCPPAPATRRASPWSARCTCPTRATPICSRPPRLLARARPARAVAARLRRRAAPAARGEGARARHRATRSCFLGRRADVPSVLVALRLVVHPSWAEGFPNAVLEAMCAGAPSRRHPRRRHPRGHASTARPACWSSRAPRRAGRRARAARSPIRSPAHVMGQRGRAHVERELLARRSMRRTVEALYLELARARSRSTSAAAAAPRCASPWRPPRCCSSARFRRRRAASPPTAASWQRALGAAGVPRAS